MTLTRSNQRRAAIESQITVLQSTGFFTTDYQLIITNMESARMSVGAAAGVVSRAYDLIASTPPSTDTSRRKAARHTRQTLATQKNGYSPHWPRLMQPSNHCAMRLPATIRRSPQNKTRSIPCRASRGQAKADITTYETSLRIDEAQLNLEKPLRVRRTLMQR